MNSRRLARRTGAATGPRLVRGCSAAGELVHECSAAGEHTAAGDLQPTQQRDRNDACLRCTSRYLHCALSLPSLQACNRTWLAACLLFLLACHGIPSVLPDASLPVPEADGSTELHLSYKLPFWEKAREITSSKVQSVLTSPRSRVRFAEESSRPFANILAHRNGLAQTVDRRLVIYE